MVGGGSFASWLTVACLPVVSGGLLRITVVERVVFSSPLWLSLPIGNLDTPAFPLEMFKYAAFISRSDLRFRPLDTCFNNRQVISSHLNPDAVESL